MINVSRLLLPQETSKFATIGLEIVHLVGRKSCLFFLNKWIGCQDIVTIQEPLVTIL